METCPHYLTFTKDSPLGALGKVNPPLRSPEDIEDLWQAAASGFLDTVGTDHVITASTTQNRDDLWNSTPGFASLGVTLPILITHGIGKGRLSWQQIAKITSENVARIFGIYPRKGVLAPGSDADFIIIDPEAKWKVDHNDWLKASEFSIYDGMEVMGRVVKTFVRGLLVGENMAPVGEKSYGEFVAPIL
jgi:dihydroorotase-like cyclic amidohydrolase